MDLEAVYGAGTYILSCACVGHMPSVLILTVHIAGCFAGTRLASHHLAHHELESSVVIIVAVLGQSEVSPLIHVLRWANAKSDRMSASFCRPQPCIERPPFTQSLECPQVRTFYTAPTLIRALEAAGDKFATKNDLSSLRILGTVGEPINAKAWNWYHKVIGGGKCPIVDTWWQTETGAILLTPLPGAWNLKPGSATLPFFGVQPVLLDEKVSERSCA